MTHLNKAKDQVINSMFFQKRVSSIFLFQIRAVQSSLQIWVTEKAAERKMLNIINSNLNNFRETHIFK